MRGTIASFPDYTLYTTPELVDAFAAGPTRLREAIDGLTEDELRAHARGPGKWSIHEIVIHTADSELQGTFRIRKVWSEPDSLLPIYDQELWSRAIGYQTESRAVRERALDTLSLLREQTLPLLRRATAHDWAKVGTHPEYGSITLRNLLELYADHVERHIDQILDSRIRIGKPLSMRSVLPRRLY